MKNLKEVSGLDIKFDEDSYDLKFPGYMQEVEPAVRELDDMREVLFDRSAQSPRKLYYMWRDVHRLNDKNLLSDYELRYDITVIPPGMIGREFIKTAGHYHPEIEGTKITYPEVYEVLKGGAHYLLQKVDGKNFDKILDVVLIRASCGDKVVIPPGYGHITINPFAEPLVMSNFVCSNFSSVYEPVKRMEGAAYYEVDTPDNFIKNENYTEIPDMRACDARDVPEFGLEKNIPLYSSFLANPGRFGYLAHPGDYMENFSKIL